MPARWFRISFAENAFLRLIAATGHRVEQLRAPDAVALVADFYRGHRAQHARITERGDALLFQWGPDADATSFAVSLTRQLIREGDDEPIVHLMLTLFYRWTPGRRALSRGHLWCFAPTELRAFERELKATAAYRAIAAAAPSTVTLHTETL